MDQILKNKDSSSMGKEFEDVVIVAEFIRPRPVIFNPTDPDFQRLRQVVPDGEIESMNTVLRMFQRNAITKEQLYYGLSPYLASDVGAKERLRQHLEVETAAEKTGIPETDPVMSATTPAPVSDTETEILVPMPTTATKPRVRKPRTKKAVPVNQELRTLRPRLPKVKNIAPILKKADVEYKCGPSYIRDPNTDVCSGRIHLDISIASVLNDEFRLRYPAHKKTSWKSMESEE